MGSKMIMFLGVLASLLYLYYCLNTKGDIFTPTSEIATTEDIHAVAKVDSKKDEVEKSIEKKEVDKEDSKKSDIAKTQTQTTTPVSTPPATPTKTASTETVKEGSGINDKTPAAFGFMSASKKQVVGLMSISDKGGKLAKKIEEICGSDNCNKDMRFEKDILKATWQDETIKILDLLTNGGIENGSIFIENNVLKLEGTVKNKKTQSQLESILKSAQNKDFKIESHTKVSFASKTPEVEPKPSVKSVAKSVKDDIPLAKTKPVEVKKAETVKAVKTVKHVTKHVPKTVVHKAQSVKKRVVKQQVVESHEVIPEPVMETTLDADARVRAILKDIKSSKPAVGMVAQPHMETTNERY